MIPNVEDGMVTGLFNEGRFYPVISFNYNPHTPLSWYSMIARPMPYFAYNEQFA